MYNILGLCPANVIQRYFVRRLLLTGHNPESALLYAYRLDERHLERVARMAFMLNITEYKQVSPTHVAIYIRSPIGSHDGQLCEYWTTNDSMLDENIK